MAKQLATHVAIHSGNPLMWHVVATDNGSLNLGDLFRPNPDGKGMHYKPGSVIESLATQDEVTAKYPLVTFVDIIDPQTENPDAHPPQRAEAIRELKRRMDLGILFDE